MKKEKDRRDRERASYSSSAAPAYGAYTNPMNDLDRRMNNVDLGQGRKTSVGEYDNRRRSTYTEAPIAGQAPTSPYNPPMAPPSPLMSAANPGYAPAAGYGVSPYPPVAPGADPYQRAASPFHGPEQAILSRSRAPSPNPMSGNPMTGVGAYGSRSRAPSPNPGGFGGPRSRAPSPNPNYGPPRPRSRAASPLPGAGPAYGAQPYGAQPGYPQGPQPSYPGGLPRSPHMGGGVGLAGHEQQPPMLPPPDGFSRPANLAQSYTFFETMKIQDMDDFYDNLPKMPMVLVPHDVYHEDWIRLCQVGFPVPSCTLLLSSDWCRTSRWRGAGSSLPPTRTALRGRRSSPPSSSTSGTPRFSPRAAWRSSSSRATNDAPDKSSAKSNATSPGLARGAARTRATRPPPIRPTCLTTSTGAAGVVVVIMGPPIRRGGRQSARQRRSARAKRRRPVVVPVNAKEHTPSTSPASPRVTPLLLPISQCV
jgi:hypothetical protein